ncbi:hypothetical protein OR235_000662 [Enterobacter cloacae]|nr:hypothetical protein [Enterobacter cloacae]
MLKAKLSPDPLRSRQRKMGSQDLSNILFRQLLCLYAICGDGLQHIAQQDLAFSFVARWPKV